MKLFVQIRKFIGNAYISYEINDPHVRWDIKNHKWYNIDIHGYNKSRCLSKRELISSLSYKYRIFHVNKRTYKLVEKQNVDKCSSRTI